MSREPRKQTNDRPWTPGPWTIGKTETSWANWALIMSGDYQVATVNGYGYPSGTANAELVALAPEMAEAILEWVSHEDVAAMLQSNKGYRRALEYERPLVELARKLREI